MSTPPSEPLAREGPAPPLPRPHRAPPKRRGRILFSLLAVLAFIGLAPLGTVAWKLIDTNREALKTSQQEYQLLLASSIAGELDSRVDALRSQLSRVARLIEAELDRSATPPEGAMRQILLDGADDGILFLRFSDLRGRPMDTRGDVPEAKDLEPLFIGGLRRSVEAIAQGSGSRRVAPVDVSGPLVLAGTPPRAVLVLSAPVVARGAFRGVVSGLADLQSVWDEVVRKNRTGHAVLALDRTGRLFASSDHACELSGEDAAQSEIGRRFLSASGRSRETLPFVMSRAGRTSRYLGSYEVTREGWGILVFAEEGQVYLPVRAMVENTLSWAAVALGLAVLAAMFFAGTLSRPIDRLAAVSRAFAAGDFSSRVAVRSRNEIGELAETFNGMASEIEEYIRRLKRAAEENNELFLGTIRALAQAIDAKDPYTRGHSVRVNRYSVIVARYLGLGREEVQRIHVASLLHDVGKIGIDDSILKKPARLTATEFEAMKTHPALGAAIMAPIRQMDAILPGLRSHHERWAGGGYPDGLTGESIPLMARIIAVADTFDAMTTDRPYQRARTLEDALRRLTELKGSGFDERVVEAFGRAYRAGEFGREEHAETRLPAAV